MIQLDGSGATRELVPGYRIAAQGLTGTAEVHDGPQKGRAGGGPELATAALDTALQSAGINEIKMIALDVRETSPPAAEATIRTAAGDDGLVLEVPDLGDTVGQVVMAVDETGVVTWHFPVDTAGRRELPGVRGAGGSKRFVIPRRDSPPPPAADGTKRGLFGLIGRKLLKVLVYPVTDAVMGPIADFAAGKWEAKKRPYGLRAFTPENFTQSDVPVLSDAEIRRLAAGPSLLFVHGTFSTAHGGFGGLPEATLTALNDRYDGRLFAFNHFTLSHDPVQNTAWLNERLAAVTDLDRLNVDIVCHSRGGLVARTLAGELPGATPAKLGVRRVIFVGAPNHGTPLADPNHMVAFIDRYTTLLNLAPPGPLSAVFETLEGIATVVKLVGHAALKGLDGLAAMNPSGTFLQKLNTGGKPQSDYFAVTSDFEPTGSLRDLVKQTVVDGIMDRVFENNANDLVVPTVGVYSGSSDPVFPISEERRLAFRHEDGVTHTQYFLEPRTSETLLTWLA